ncbi:MULTISPECIES: hypothetical protein [unclassified Rhodosalinus]|uniref:hypothetical protein n=1 Tax=unclassified Rhodosalinus TaxID=2630183 RepID=UPI0035262FB8
MMVRAFAVALGLSALAACSPAVPDSGPGFDDYDVYEARRAARDAALEAPVTVRPPAAAESPLDAARAALAEPGASGEAAAAPPRSAREDPMQASPSNPPPVVVNNPGLSDENDFEAVSERRGIESDAERLARAQAQYQVIQPEALPERPGAREPNVVAFALQTTHPVGTRVWSRAGINAEARFRRNCAEYASSDRAQADFLARGGPERDPRGLDPDGDGYACAWTPAPFRAAVRD